MRNNNNVMTNAEKKLSKQGFYLLEHTVLKIDHITSYPVLKYARFLDNEKKYYNMVITFDPSQYSIELWQENSTTVFTDPTLLKAIQERAEELNF